MQLRVQANWPMVWFLWTLANVKLRVAKVEPGILSPFQQLSKLRDSLRSLNWGRRTTELVLVITNNSSPSTPRNTAWYSAALPKMFHFPDKQETKHSLRHEPQMTKALLWSWERTAGQVQVWFGHWDIDFLLSFLRRKALFSWLHQQILPLGHGLSDPSKWWWPTGIFTSKKMA